MSERALDRLVKKRDAEIALLKREAKRKRAEELAFVREVKRHLPMTWEVNPELVKGLVEALVALAELEAMLEEGEDDGSQA